MLKHTVEEGFMRAAYLDMLQVAADPAAMIKLLQRYTPPMIDKWAEKRNAV
jgi:predicted Rossmann-fold nucleotide-binding protein